MSPRCYSPIQGRARELNVRLNSTDPTQHTPLLARLISMNTQPNQHHNLIRDDILSLVQYGIHFRNPDKPVLIITLQLLLHDLLQFTLLDQSLSHSPNINTSPFTITGDCHEHTPYAHNQDLHQWFDVQLSTDTVDQHDNQPLTPSPLLYEVEEFLTVVDEAMLSYYQDITHFLSFTEWRTTLRQHSTLRPTDLLSAPIIAWYKYTPNITHPYGTQIPTPNTYINTFQVVRLWLQS